MDDEGRPFKKARHIWQLKGKYHMKAGAEKLQPQQCHQRAWKSSHECGNNSSDPASVYEIISKQDISNTDCIDRLLINSKLRKEEKLDDIPLTLVLPNMQYHQGHQDEFLGEWHANQMATSCFDNTINSLLELWKVAGIDNNLLDYMDNDDHVEDEAILMAIQSHGLHRGVQPVSTVQQETAASILHLSEARTETAQNNDSVLSAAITSAIKRKGLSSYGHS